MLARNFEMSKVIFLIISLFFNSLFCVCFFLFLNSIQIQVLPGLYVGNYRDSKDPQQLERHQITHIIAIHDSPRRLLPVNQKKKKNFQSYI